MHARVWLVPRLNSLVLFSIPTNNRIVCRWCRLLCLWRKIGPVFPTKPNSSNILVFMTSCEGMEHFRHHLSKSQVEMICALYSKTVGLLMLGGLLLICWLHCWWTLLLLTAKRMLLVFDFASCLHWCAKSWPMGRASQLSTYLFEE